MKDTNIDGNQVPNYHIYLGQRISGDGLYNRRNNKARVEC